MHLMYSFDANAPSATKAFVEIEMVVYNFWWALDSEHEDQMPPKVIDPHGLDSVVGHKYAPKQRPPGLFVNRPYIHIPNAKELWVRYLTHESKETVAKFEICMMRIQNKYPAVFSPPDATTFGPATPERVREVLRREPELHELLNKSLADEFGVPRDASGEMDSAGHLRVQRIINAPEQGGMLTMEEFVALKAQGRA